MTQSYERLRLVERTPEWWEWRRSGITSSDAAAILGDKFAPSPERLLLEKQQQAPKRSARYFEQARSATRERHARDHYCRTVGITVAAACVQNMQRPWQRASLDGLSADGAHAVEIKCGQSTYAAAAARQQPARRHYPQLQHILAVTGLQAIDYYCYCPPHPPLRLAVARDEAFVQRLIAAEECFWQRLAPSLTPIAGSTSR
jgi:putative phage-type endonuclease